MIKPIVKDPFLLSRPSSPATADDIATAQDLRDTLRAHAHECVGMAANMIGVTKRIIIVDDGGTALVMVNPEIVSHAGAYETQEGCLSLAGLRTTQRWKTVRVQFETEKSQARTKTFTGRTAQIIQHEIDHCNGVLI